MKISCGTDIIEINRVKEAIETYEEKFQTEIFTKKEVEYCESHKMQRFQHYAARFAAKEAIFKAISTKLDKTYRWTDFEITNNEIGKPEVTLKTKIPEIENIDISLSHCKDYAVATAVVLIKE
ncbi:MAG: holo-ACP synthase [Clostridia bacterium]|nr:holo-ACP synthase [Clostridia bacterium]